MNASAVVCVCAPTREGVISRVRTAKPVASAAASDDDPKRNFSLRYHLVYRIRAFVFVTSSLRCAATSCSSAAAFVCAWAPCCHRSPRCARRACRCLCVHGGRACLRAQQKTNRNKINLTIFSLNPFAANNAQSLHTELGICRSSKG